MAFADYVREFRVVEVQQTFYEPPRDATLLRWRRQAPLRFEFTLKAWQLVTHEASSPTYLRLHGITGARHVYSDDELAAIAAKLPAAGTAYVMFNNLPRIGDARRFA